MPNYIEFLLDSANDRGAGCRKAVTARPHTHGTARGAERRDNPYNICNSIRSACTPGNPDMTDQDGDYHMANVDDIDFSQKKKKKRRIPTTSNLHRDGWHALRSRPDWSVLAFCEAQHDQWCQRAIDVLQSLSHTWDDSEYPNQRPGEVTAVEANRILHGEGAKVWISTTHPSVEQFYPYAITGPRWYCSIIQAARSGGGCCLDSGDLRGWLELHGRQRVGKCSASG